MYTAIIAISLVPLTGWAGQVNFAPLAFAGFGGFVYLRDRPGEERLRASVWEASVQLIDRSPAFRDLLGPATLIGEFSARRDDAAVNRLLHRLSAHVTRELGYPRLVGGSPETAEAPTGSRPGG